MSRSCFPSSLCSSHVNKYIKIERELCYLLLTKMSIPTKIKAIKLQPDAGLAIEEVELSTSLAPYEVLVKNRAVGLNPTDW